MVWDLVPRLVTLAPGETRNLTCPLDPEAWCFIKSGISFKIDKDDNNNKTIQVNGSLDCPMASDIDTIVHPVCDNMLVYCINAPSCTNGSSYRIGPMQRNPYYIHINENVTCSSENVTPTESMMTPREIVVPSESVPCPKCTVCPTPAQSMDCPTPTVCPTLTQSMDCPTLTVCPTPAQSMDCPTTVCPTPAQSMDCPTPTVCPTHTTACPTPPECLSPTKYQIENSNCPFNMSTKNLTGSSATWPSIQKLTQIHVGVVLVTLTLISLN